MQTTSSASLVVTAFLISSEVLAPPPVPPHYGHYLKSHLGCSLSSPLLTIHPTNKLGAISIRKSLLQGYKANYNKAPAIKEVTGLVEKLKGGTRGWV